MGIGGLLLGLAAVSFAGLFSFLAFNDPLDIMGSYGDGVGEAGWNGWLGMWAYGLMIWAVVGLLYLASRWLDSREPHSDLLRQRDRLKDEVESLKTEKAEVLGMLYELRDRASRVEELEELCSDLRSENVSSREHIRFLEETNSSLHRLNDELFSELEQQNRSNKTDTSIEDDHQSEGTKLMAQPKTKRVRLVDVGLGKVSVIKAIREVTDAGLKETKQLVEAAPVIVPIDLSPEVATGLVAAIEKSGAHAEICN